MSGTRNWLIVSGAVALGASAVVGMSGDFGPGLQSGGPGVRLNPAASTSAVPGVEQSDLTGADTGTDQGAGGRAQAVTPASPEPVEAADQQSAVAANADSPDSASAASADSPESAD